MRWRLAALTSLSFASTGLAANENATEDLAGRALSFFHTVAEWIGEGLVRLVDMLLPGAPPPGIQEPLGYLGLLTVILLVFGIVAAARKIIWLLVGIGWILMAVRIILHAVGTI